MVTATQSRYEKYFADFKAFEQGVSRNGGGWVHALRERAMERFAETGMPVARRGNERWKYTNVRPIARAAFEYALKDGPGQVSEAELTQLVPWHETWTTLVFVDGRYSPSLSRVPSDDALEIMDLPTAIEERRELVKPRLAGYARLGDDDGFASLNTAFMGDGAFLRIRSGGVAQTPVQVLFITTQRDSPIVTYPRLLVVAEEGSNATLIESYFGLSEDEYFTNGVTEIELQPGATLDHYRVMLESERAFHIGTTRVHQGRDSTLNSISFALGASLGRNDLFVSLDAPGAACTLNGLYMCSGKQHLDNHISLMHAKPHGSSSQYYKGILTDKSRAVFSGEVRVEPGAQKTYANQKDMNLLLSEGAEVDTKPSLLIFADDVQCFHGAAAGELDENALFYMLSRGVDRDVASQMLIRAFADEIIEGIKSDVLAEYIHRLMDRLMPQFRFQEPR